MTALASGNRPHPLVREILHKRDKRAPFKPGVGIQKDEDLMAGLRHGPSQRARLASIGLANEAHTRIDCDNFLYHRGGVVHRAVVDDEQFHLPGVAGVEDRQEGRVNDFFFVVSGDDDGHRRVKSEEFVALPVMLGGQNRDQDSTDDDQPGG